MALTRNKARTYSNVTRQNSLALSIGEAVYEGAAVGIVDATGHARPLNAADRFGGFAEFKADNSAGAAAAIAAVFMG